MRPVVSKKPLILLGSGEHSYSVYESTRMTGGCPYELAGFSQNLDPGRNGATFEGLPEYWIEDLRPLAATHEALCVLGDCAAKRAFVERVERMGFRFGSMRSAMTLVSRRSTLREGHFLGWGVTVSGRSRIGRHATLLNQTFIGDAATLGDFVYCAPGVRIGRSCRIGDAAFMGMGSIVAEGVRVGENAVIGVGAVVLENVPKGATMVGNPARPLGRISRPFREAGSGRIPHPDL